MTTKAVLYMRFSPRRNEDECASIETQRSICAAYCEDRGYQIVSEHSDRGMSGDDVDRPGLWTAIGSLKRGYLLVAYRMDRLARSVYLMEVIHRDVASRNATVEIVDGSRNGDSPEDQMVRQILGAFSEYERKVIAARTKAAMLQHQKNGYRMSRYTVYGTRPDPDDPARTLPSPREQEILGIIKDKAASGCGDRAIARWLNENGHKARNRKDWTPAMIYRQLERNGWLKLRGRVRPVGTKGSHTAPQESAPSL